MRYRRDRCDAIDSQVMNLGDDAAVDSHRVPTILSNGPYSVTSASLLRAP